MAYEIDFATASSDAIIQALCRRLEEVRLSRNITQADLARKAGVSRSTMTRLANGKSLSLDSFVRIIAALGLAGNFASMLPELGLRPVDMVMRKGKERQRARSKRNEAKTGSVSEWTWG